MEANVEIVHPVSTARCNSHCSALHQPSQHAAFSSAAHWLLQSPHLPMVRQSILTTTTPLLITKGRRTNIPEKAPRTNDRSNGSPQKPVGPMFCDANIGPTGYIVMIQLRLRSFGIPACFCFHLHRKWQALKSGSLSASDG